MTVEAQFLEFINGMEKSKDYLKVSDLKDNCSYQIYARNAYVGIWIAKENSFLISRYKMSLTPFLFMEVHWDIENEELLGTVKPLKLIEKSPFEIDRVDVFAETASNSRLLNYLDQLEEDNPIIQGYNTLKQRKDSVKSFLDKRNAQRQLKNELDAQGISIKDYQREQKKRQQIKGDMS